MAVSTEYRSVDMSDAPQMCQSMSELTLNPHSLNDRKAYVERCIRAGFTSQRFFEQARHEFHSQNDCISKLMLGWYKATGGKKGKRRKRKGKKQKQDEANAAANVVDIAPL